MATRGNTNEDKQTSRRAPARKTASKMMSDGKKPSTAKAKSAASKPAARTKSGSKSAAKKVSIKPSIKSSKPAPKSKPSTSKFSQKKNQALGNMKDSTLTEEMEHQSPLESLEAHQPNGGSTHEMNTTVSQMAQKKNSLPSKVKEQNKTAKNVSHSRSHSSQYRG